MLDKLTRAYEEIAEKVRAGKLPLVARIPAIKKVVDEYALAKAEYYDRKREEGVIIPLEYRRDGSLLEKFANLILYEELKWSHPDKMSIVEYPITSDTQEDLREEKYRPTEELTYGDMRYTGRKKTHFTDEDGSPQVRNKRLVSPEDAAIENVITNVDLAMAIEQAKLTERQKQALYLVYFEGMTQEEAGKEMGLAHRRIVGKYIDTAIEKIRKIMVTN